MRKRFNVYNKNIDADVQVTYNEHGLLMGIEILRDDITEHAIIEKIFNALNKNYEDAFKYLLDRGIKMVKVFENISFDAFWDAYNYKDASSKIKSKKIWEKLSDLEKTKAIQYIPKYDNILKSKNTAKKYAETYLNSQIYNQ